MAFLNGIMLHLHRSEGRRPPCRRGRDRSFWGQCAWLAALSTSSPVETIWLIPGPFLPQLLTVHIVDTLSSPRICVLCEKAGRLHLTPPQHPGGCAGLRLAGWGEETLSRPFPWPAGVAAREPKSRPQILTRAGLGPFTVPALTHSRPSRSLWGARAASGMAGGQALYGRRKTRARTSAAPPLSGYL